MARQSARMVLEHMGVRAQAAALMDVIRGWSDQVRRSQLLAQLASNRVARKQEALVRATLTLWTQATFEAKAERRGDELRTQRRGLRTLRAALLAWHWRAMSSVASVRRAADIGSRRKALALSSCMAAWAEVARRGRILRRTAATVQLRNQRSSLSACFSVWAARSRRGSWLRLAVHRSLHRSARVTLRAVLGQWADVTLPSRRRSSADVDGGRAERFIQRRRLSRAFHCWRLEAVDRRYRFPTLLSRAVGRWRSALVARSLGKWLDLAKQRTLRRTERVAGMTAPTRLWLTAMLGSTLWSRGPVPPTAAADVDDRCAGEDRASVSSAGRHMDKDDDPVGIGGGERQWHLSISFQGWKMLALAGSQMRVSLTIR